MADFGRQSKTSRGGAAGRGCRRRCVGVAGFVWVGVAGGGAAAVGGWVG